MLRQKVKRFVPSFSKRSVEAALTKLVGRLKNLLKFYEINHDMGNRRGFAQLIGVFDRESIHGIRSG